MAEERLQFLRRVVAALDPGPLEPGDPRREPLRERSGMDDPIAMIRQAITTSPIPTLHLFAGFSGVGKTTELFRLKQDLERDGYLVLYVNAEEYFSLNEPPTIGDLLLGITGGFEEALREAVPGMVPRDGFWQRITEWITSTESRLNGAEASVEYTSPAKTVLGGLKMGLKLKTEFKTGSNFFRALQQFLSNSLAELERDVQDYINQLVADLREARDEDTAVVLIFDQLERMRGQDNWHQAIRATRALFTDHLHRLRLPEVHCVYSVPAWLKLVPGGMPVALPLPTIPLWEHQPDRPRSQKGFDLFRAVVRRRLNDADAKRLFGPDAFAADGPIDRLVAASGGHIRDLLGLIHRVVRRARTEPVDSDVIGRAIAEVRREFGPIAVDDAKLLYDIAQTQDLRPASMDAPTIERLSYLLDTHMVSYFGNGSEWFDVHPLILDEIVKRHHESEASDGRNPGDG